MNLNLLTVEQSYDPGFTVVATYSQGAPAPVELYTREKDGVIGRPHAPAEHRLPAILTGLRAIDVTPLRDYMNDFANAEQIRRGWRDSA